jgi:hypothetical protein
MSLLVVWLAVRDRERERAERERERAELLSLVDSSERRLLSRMGRVLSEEAFVRAHRCVFALSWAKDGAPHGVGVLCGAPGSAVTAAHNLAEKPGVTHVFGKVYPFVGDEEATATVLTLEVVKVNLVRAAQQHEAAVAGRGVHQLQARRQQVAADGAVGAPVGQLPVGAAVVAGGAAVEHEALGAAALLQHEGRVVQAVAAPAQRLVVRQQLRVAQHLPERAAVRARHVLPAEAAAEILAACGAVA